MLKMCYHKELINILGGSYVHSRLKIPKAGMYCKRTLYMLGPGSGTIRRRGPVGVGVVL